MILALVLVLGLTTPPSYVCTTDVPGQAKRFTLANPMGREPRASLLDAPLMYARTRSGRREIVFSNECDDFYVLDLPARALMHQAAVVAGALTYSEPDRGSAGSDTVSVTCRRT